MKRRTRNILCLTSLLFSIAIVALRMTGDRGQYRFAFTIRAQMWELAVLKGSISIDNELQHDRDVATAETRAVEVEAIMWHHRWSIPDSSHFFANPDDRPVSEPEFQAHLKEITAENERCYAELNALGYVPKRGNPVAVTINTIPAYAGNRVMISPVATIGGIPIFLERPPPPIKLRRYSVPWFLLVCSALIAPAAWLHQQYQVRRRLRRGLCAACGYDIRTSPERCPECGVETKNSHRR